MTSRVPVYVILCKQVSANGLISFRDGFSDFHVSGFPRNSNDDVLLIAPLWADFDLRQGGNVYYRVTTDPDTLDLAKQMIAENNSFSEFSPSCCLIVTWEDAVLLSRSLDELVTT